MSHTAPPQVVLTPLRSAAPSSGTLDVLVRVQAPDRPAEASSQPRPPLRLALVIDRSGSMSGQPLQEALRCAEYIADGLQRADQVGIVLYANEVRVALPMVAGGDVHAVRQALDGVQSGGTTALFDGWEAGARLLEGAPAGAASRVMLLSDGQANAGLIDPIQVEAQCAAWAARGITTTTVGLGSDFNENLMIGMAKAGAGQQYYGQTAQDLHDSFDEELSLLQSLYMRRLKCKVIPGTGVVAELLGLLPSAADWNPLSDLAWGSEAWMLVRLHIAKSAGADPRTPEAVLAVVVEGEFVEGAAASSQSLVLSLPVVSPPDWAGLPTNELVGRRVKEVGFAIAAQRISAMAAANDLEGARRLLRVLADQVQDVPWLADKVRNMVALLERNANLAAKEMIYSSHRSAGRLAQKVERPYLASETDRADIPAFLRRKGSEGESRKRRP